MVEKISSLSKESQASIENFCEQENIRDEQIQSGFNNLSCELQELISEINDTIEQNIDDLVRVQTKMERFLIELGKKPVKK